jgi:hypothetical protein
MSRFNISPRGGHLKVVKRILAYLKKFPKERIIVDTTIQTIILTPLKIIPTGRTSIQILKKKYPMMFLSPRHRSSR